MKTYTLPILFCSLICLLTNCNKDNSEFLQKKWKIQSVTYESKCLKIPLKETLRHEAYILQFSGSTNFDMPTSVNAAGGNYEVISDEKIMIRNYQERSEIGNEREYQKQFDEQLLAAFGGTMTYTYTKNKLIFRGEHNQKIIFERQ